MRLVPIRQNIPKRTRQDVQMRGINLTDHYADGEMESCKGISSDRYPYITTQEQPAAAEFEAQNINQWDEQWELVSDKVTSLNYIPVIPDAEYCFIKPANLTGVTILYYDADYSAIGAGSIVSYGVSAYNFTPTSNAVWMKIQLPTTYGTEYNHDISLNYPSTYKTYYAYEIPYGTKVLSMFAWEKLFIVTDAKHGDGYRCYYGGEYCGDAVNTELPKQYAVVNNRLVMFPDKIYFNLYDETMTAHQLGTAARLMTVNSGTVIMRKAVSE